MFKHVAAALFLLVAPTAGAAPTKGPAPIPQPSAIVPQPAPSKEAAPVVPTFVSVAAAPARSEGSKFPLQAAAIFTAILIFLGREFLEARRRKAANGRKLAAVKAYLARQCEFNNWAYDSLKRTITRIEGGLREGIDEVYEVSVQRNGSIRLTTRERDGEWAGGSTLPAIRVAELEERLMDAAELDEKLQELTDNAAAGAAEMQHVRDSLVSHILKEDEIMDSDDMFLGFTEYALGELEDDYAAFDALYQYCTGKKLESKRLR